MWSCWCCVFEWVVCWFLCWFGVVMGMSSGVGLLFLFNVVNGVLERVGVCKVM